jgi:uncharacterized protein YdhG (YjbR/CyaY superfamily)
MTKKKAGYSSMTEYFSDFPPDVRKRLQQVRAAVKEAVPGAKEGISYQIPAFMLNGKYFLSFAAWKRHIGMYPIPAGTPAFQKAAAKYRSAKSTLNFPMDEPLPLGLIRKTAKYRAAEFQAALKAKAAKKK